MSNNRWKILTDTKCLLAECPVWDRKTNTIFWVNIPSGEVFCFSPTTGRLYNFNAGQPVGCIGLKRSGGLIAGTKDGFATIDVDNGRFELIRELEPDLPNNRMNDGKCDPAGRFWAGTMSDLEEPGLGSLYVLGEDYSITVKVREITCSNGLAWSLDHKTFYYIDTATQCVTAYDYETANGALSNKRIAIDFRGTSVYPDGMTIDEEGMLWIALWDGWKVVRCDPRSGKQIHEIRLPVARVTSCVFGGDGLEDLYITTATEGLSAKDLEMQPLAGSLFVVEASGFKGVEAFEFDG